MKKSRIRNIVMGVSTIALAGALVVSGGLWAWPVAAQVIKAPTKTPTIELPTTTPTTPEQATPTVAAPETEETEDTEVEVTTTMAETPAPMTDLPRTITVVGKGTITVKPDTAQATLGVETVGDNVKDATSESSDIMGAILTALTDLGIEEKDIQTSGFSVWSERNPGPEGTQSETVKYRVMNTVNVKVRDLEQVGAALDAAIEAGANSVQGVNFYLDKTTEIESQAREKAVLDARAKAEELATLNDVEVGAVVSISEVVGGAVPYTNFNMREVAYGMGGGGAGPISPGELDMSTTLQITYAIQ